jgi:glycosyltransferase involved in cell wall biosynthesis
MLPQSEAPLVSIIIPCYNQAHFLVDSIESALAQTYGRTELVVVDDGSSDNTAELAARYPVRYVRQPNRGVAEARNCGFNASAGEYVIFLDADDRLTCDSVQAHLHCLAAHPGVGFVVGEIEWIDKKGSCIGTGKWELLKQNHYEELLKVNHVANTIAVMFRRSVLEHVGGFSSFFSPAEDYEILLRAGRSFPSAHHSAVVAQYRRHSTNTSRKGAVMLRATHRVMLAERYLVKGNRRLEAALREGHHHWRDFYGAVTIKEIWADLRRRDLAHAVQAFAALIRYVRGRIFVIPWRFRDRAMAEVLRQFGILQTRLRFRRAGRP